MSNKIQDARRVMRDAFAEDGPGPGTFRHAYQSNIAMIIFDRFIECVEDVDTGELHEECNKAADSIIACIFESGFDDKAPEPVKLSDTKNAFDDARPILDA